MCDTSIKSSCHKSSGKWLKPVKLLRWERPITTSNTYWQEFLNEMQAKLDKVRNPYPTLSPISKFSKRLNNSKLSENIKFKISPPTPLHKKVKSAKKGKDNSLEKGSGIRLHKGKNIKEPNSNFNERIQLSLHNLKNSTRKYDIVKQNIKGIRKISIISPRLLGKSESVSGSNEIAKSSLQKPSGVLHDKKISLDPIQTTCVKSVAASSGSVSDIQQFIPVGIENRKFVKAPKLGAASLLPSFARAVSTDSSVDTRSLDSLEDIVKVEYGSVRTQANNVVLKKDFLRVPNLSFVSSHPSFHKLSPDHSHDEYANSINRSIKFFPENMKLDEISFDEQSLGNVEVKIYQPKEKKKKKLTKTLKDYETEFGYKALQVIKNRCASKRNKIGVSNLKTFVSPFQPSGLSLKFKDKNVTCSMDSKSCKDENNTILKTIDSSSRSISGSSPNFQENSVFTPSTDILLKIPQTTMLKRSHIDRCHACLFKPFKSHVKICCETPLTVIKTVIENSCDFKPSGSSTNSLLSDLSSLSDLELDDDRPLELSRLETFLDDVSTEKIPDEGDVRDRLRVTFDTSKLSPIAKSNFEAFPINKNTPSKEQASKSFSIQSSDRSKTSTPSNHSSDSEETHPQEDKLSTSKYLVPCHAPLVWSHSLEHLRALKNKSFMSIQARSAANMAKSSEESESNSEIEDGEDKTTTGDDPLIISEEIEKAKDKPKKSLVRMKTIADNITALSSSTDSQIKSKRVLKRSKTTFDLATALNELKVEERQLKETESEGISPTTINSEKIKYSDIILKHKAVHPLPTIMSTQEVFEIIKESLENNVDPIELIERLEKEFAQKVEKVFKGLKDTDEKHGLELGMALLKTLVHSRRYLKPDIFDPNLEFFRKQPTSISVRLLKRLLSPDVYDNLAPIFGICNTGDNKTDRQVKIQLESDHETESIEIDTRSVFVEPATVDETSSAVERQHNPYTLFMKKSRRKAVVWRPLNEKDLKGFDPEATLEMRAARLLDKICKDFCEWSMKLGQQVIDEETLKDMFEVNFSSDACKAMQVVLQEMPTVPKEVVKARYYRPADELEATRKQIAKDLKVETCKSRVYGFGTALPHNIRFVPPRNRIGNKWKHCKYIPTDLKTMDVVWSNIMHLDSVQAFVNYLEQNQEIVSEDLLKNLSNRKANEIKYQLKKKKKIIK